MVKEIDYLINEVYSKQLMIAKMKYNMLRQQINPHFLYNTLDTVNWKAIQSGNEEISVMVRSSPGFFEARSRAGYGYGPRGIGSGGRLRCHPKDSF